MMMSLVTWVCSSVKPAVLSLSVTRNSQSGGVWLGTAALATKAGRRKVLC